MKRIIGLFIVLIFVVVPLSIMMTGCGDAEPKEDPNLSFTLNESETGYNVRGKSDVKTTVTEITIPAEYEGKPVIAISAKAFNGFTALINSLCSLPTTKAPGCTSAIVEVEPKLFSDKNLSAFADILLTAAAQGLCNIQFNVVDADILRDAQLHPENHRNLAVRVSGFSQKFCLLDKNMQDHIIARTKHQFL